MLMFSDGIDRPMVRTGSHGVERLTAFLPPYAGASPEVICEAVEQSVVGGHSTVAAMGTSRCWPSLAGHTEDVLASY